MTGPPYGQVEAYGKHLLVDLSPTPTTSARTIHVHLGMRGKWLRFSPVTSPTMRDRRVDKRDTCYDCGKTIVVADLAGRTSYPMLVRLTRVRSRSRTASQ